MKRIASILLLIAVVLTTGCNKTEQTSEPNSAESITSNSTAESSSAEIKVTAEPVVTEETKYAAESAVTEKIEVSEEEKKYSAEGIECEPIDKSADCEAILLEKADRLQTLIFRYLNNDTEKLAYKFGEAIYNEYEMSIGAKVISDEMSCYSEFKAMFADCIYGDFFDWISTHSLVKMFDIDGVLYGSPHEGGLLGVVETWYLGCDVQDDRIVGHFAELRGMGEPEEKTAEYLNDESNYWFYDITVQNVNGEYVITDCRETTSGKNYVFYDEHGLYYNSGYADRSLITNKKVMPK